MKGKMGDMCYRMRGGKISEPVMKGKTPSSAVPTRVHSGANSTVLKDARQRKRGGAVEGDMPMKRMDRRPRASGGRVGADSSPFTAARAEQNRPGARFD